MDKGCGLLKKKKKKVNMELQQAIQYSKKDHQKLENEYIYIIHIKTKHFIC